MSLKKLFFLSFSLLIPFISFLSVKAETQKGSVLFDAGHAQEAGNADWVIEGAYSDFANLLRAHGYQVDGTKQRLTIQLLEQYDTLVIPEPNNIFTESEQRAIIKFIANGGGVFFIGNHLKSDRNRNGIDSVGIYNQFVTELGFRFEDASFLKANLSAEPMRGNYIEHPITHKVDQIAIWAGTSIKIHNPERVQGLISFSEYLYGQPALATGTYGLGRFVAVGDSAIFDDGSGTNPSENLHKGYFEYDHQQLALNVINWLNNHPAEDI